MTRPAGWGWGVLCGIGFAMTGVAFVLNAFTVAGIALAFAGVTGSIHILRTGEAS